MENFMEAAKAQIGLENQRKKIVSVLLMRGIYQYTIDMASGGMIYTYHVS
jgi:hypothetical protein